MKFNPSFHFNIPAEAQTLFEKSSKSIKLYENYTDLAADSMGGEGSLSYEVQYEVPGKGMVTEAIVHKVTNGISANYPEPYMRRRDPDTMLIADDKPTDKELFIDRMGVPFDGLRQETIEWLASQDLAIFFFKIGLLEDGPIGMAIAPANAGTFNTGSSLFAVLLAGVVLIVGALTFLPALALGPIVDQLFMLQGKVF